MKKQLLSAALVLLASLSASAAFAQTSGHDPETEQDYGPGFWDSDVDMTDEDAIGGETSSQLSGSEDEVRGQQEDIIRREGLHSFMKMMIEFPQTKWNECKDQPSGNYEEYACAQSRTVSVILNKYLREKLMSCVDAGMAAQGGGTAAALHITHAGVTADARHSPYSLHSKNRAIDVKVLKVELTNGEVRQFTYSKVGNRPFYTAMRKCWGGVVHSGNGCPLYSGNAGLTGSIGWENKQHGRHMHLSVPYCVNGAYGSGLWRR